MIYLSSQQLQQIHRHAEITYPEECCGLLLGNREKNYKRVIEVRETENSWTSEMNKNLSNVPSSNQQPLSKKNRFSIDPYTLLQVQKEVRDRSLMIIGIYHSHPDYPAIPSAFDQEIAWPQYSYLIASLRQGKIAEVKSWTLKEREPFAEETIKIVAKSDFLW
ncbi:putative Mov34/MPN/PAD-1 [Crocosphaera subtropica ATCC 51142]|uniref:Mov34/MPN/PAD-1 n=1 Tax=Crocosphaera subtropica (strain ATCC 51142 / BH68) TaxID=43989 RepID=B1X0D6_CROS5|nr:M67 family metallopeptidase [Crocosphaera subtropica]ACB51225.1 putative Mov34/MPN/PAD-1 [Crocosphaera subtropica ATCC 51142]